jgi:hypothetical protein
MSFKVIIAGSRSFEDYEYLKKVCDKALSQVTDEIVIVSGCAKGADSLGEQYARERGYKIDENPAPWNDTWNKPRTEIGFRGNKAYWHRAGVWRNEEMAKKADALIAFDKGTPGTKNMIELAYKYKLKTKIYRV